MEKGSLFLYELCGTLEDKLGRNILHCIKHNKINDKFIDCVTNALPETIEYLCTNITQVHTNKDDVSRGTNEFESCYKNIEQLISISLQWQLIDSNVYEIFNDRKKFVEEYNNLEREHALFSVPFADNDNLIVRNETRFYVSLISYYLKNRDDSKAFDIIRKKFDESGNKPIYDIIKDIVGKIDSDLPFLHALSTDAVYIKNILTDELWALITKR